MDNNQVNFENWKNALISENVEDAVSLYDSNLTRPCEGSKQSSLIQRDLLIDVYVALRNGKFKNTEFVYLGTNSYIHTGWFSVSNITTVGQGHHEINAIEESIEIRFSYIWQKKDGKWSIVHYHISSEYPVRANELASTVSTQCPLSSHQDRYTTQVQILALKLS